MQPLIPGVIKIDYASAYIVGMTDTGATLRGHIRTLINGLITDGVWPRLKYLGVIQNLEADTKRCLVRRTSAFSSKPQSSYQGLLYTSNSGYSIDTSVSPERRGTISSGYTPDPSDVAFRDSHMLFQYLGNNGATAPATGGRAFMGRYDDELFMYISYIYRSGTDVLLSLRSGYEMAGFTEVTNFDDAPQLTGFNSPEFQCIGRNNSSTVRYRKNLLESTVTLSRTDSWAWFAQNGPDASVHHLGANANGSAISDLRNTARLCAWGMADGQMSSTQTGALHTRLNTYLTAIGAL